MLASSYLPASRVAILLSKVSLLHFELREGGTGGRHILYDIPPTSMKLGVTSVGIGGSGILGGFIGIRRTVLSIEGTMAPLPVTNAALFTCR